jgi:hypothetical protein
MKLLSASLLCVFATTTFAQTQSPDLPNLPTTYTNKHSHFAEVASDSQQRHPIISTATDWRLNKDVNANYDANPET